MSPSLCSIFSLIVCNLEDGVHEKDVLAVDGQSGLQHLLLRSPVVNKISVNLFRGKAILNVKEGVDYLKYDSLKNYSKLTTTLQQSKIIQTF